MDNSTVKKTWGGAREGAGKKKSVVKQYMVYAPQDIYDILESVPGKKSDYICRCIRFAQGRME